MGRMKWAAVVGATLLLACASPPQRRPADDFRTLEGTRVKLAPEHAEPELVRVVHRVEPGQTLYRIAKTYGLTPHELAAANGFPETRPIEVGQELIIPGAAESRDVPGKEPETVETPAQGALAKPPPVARLPAQEGVLKWPLRGVIYARFGRKGKEPHDGIDLAAPVGTPIHTAAPGTVLFAGEQRGYGLIVIVDHHNGLVTIYAHNRDLRVRSGQAVRDGQVIATVGESGRTSGPHLHFEVRRDGSPVDPLRLLGSPPSA